MNHDGADRYESRAFSVEPLSALTEDRIPQEDLRPLLTGFFRAASLHEVEFMAYVDLYLEIWSRGPYAVIPTEMIGRQENLKAQFISHWRRQVNDEVLFDTYAARITLHAWRKRRPRLNSGSKTQSVSITASPEQIEHLRELGNGNVSAGVRKLVGAENCRTERIALRLDSPLWPVKR